MKGKGNSGGDSENGGGGFKRPKWMGGGGGSEASGSGSADVRPSAPGRNRSGFLSLFAGRSGEGEGRLRL
jgi:hypothetical protein